MAVIKDNVTVTRIQVYSLFTANYGKLCKNITFKNQSHYAWAQFTLEVKCKRASVFLVSLKQKFSTPGTYILLYCFQAVSR